MNTTIGGIKHKERERKRQVLFSVNFFRGTVSKRDTANHVLPIMRYSTFGSNHLSVNSAVLLVKISGYWVRQKVCIFWVLPAAALWFQRYLPPQ